MFRIGSITHHELANLVKKSVMPVVEALVIAFLKVEMATTALDKFLA